MAAQSASDTVEYLHSVAGAVEDPELPPLTLADLGILRGVTREHNTVIVTLTPTYSGCPAVEFIENEVRRVLEAATGDPVQIVRSFSPAWTTDWITAEGRAKMTAAGIAPPLSIGTSDVPGRAVPVALGTRRSRAVSCPRCGSTTTRMLSAFGSTACKALYRCMECQEPFDYFKEI